MVKLVALRRGLYGTRRLHAGDTFDVDRNAARVWVGIGKARYADNVAPRASVREQARDDSPSPAAVNDSKGSTAVAAMGSDAGLVQGVKPQSEMSVDALRTAYAFLTGQPADKRWSRETLYRKVNEARGA